MVSNPTFSIIIPLYNKERQIARTLDSVLAQTVENFEVVVVDDGSQDKSAEIVKGYTDSRIRYIQKENGGVSSARNRGILEARGEWILFLDADDEFHKEGLAVYSDLLKKYPGKKVYLTQTDYLQNGVHIYPAKTFGDGESQYPYFSAWMNRFYPGSGNMMVSKQWIEQLGGFDERMSFFEDYEFGWRMLSTESLAYSDKICRIYNQDTINGESLSQKLPPVDKEMLHYIPEMKFHGFWSKALLYEVLVMELSSGRHSKEFKALKRKYFSGVNSFCHWLRQKMLNHHLI